MELVPLNLEECLKWAYRHHAAITYYKKADGMEMIKILLTNRAGQRIKGTIIVDGHGTAATDFQSLVTQISHKLNLE